MNKGYKIFKVIYCTYLCGKIHQVYPPAFNPDIDLPNHIRISSCILGSVNKYLVALEALYMLARASNLPGKASCLEIVI